MKLIITKLHKFDDFKYSSDDKYNYFMFSIDLNKLKFNFPFSFYQQPFQNLNFISNDDNTKQFIEIKNRNNSNLNFDNLPILYKLNLDNIIQMYKPKTLKQLNSSNLEQIQYTLYDEKYDDSMKDNLKYKLFDYLYSLPDSMIFNISNIFSEESTAEIANGIFDISDNFIFRTQYNLYELNSIFITKSNEAIGTTSTFKYNISK